MKKQCGLVNNEWIEPPRLQDALATLLNVCGFDTMAREVLEEGDHAGLSNTRVSSLRTCPTGSAETLWCATSGFSG